MSDEEQAVAALPIHCSHCGAAFPLRDMIRPIIRETLLELDNLIGLEDKDPDEAPKTDPNDRASGSW